jgi:hypothetical protein
MMTSSMARSVCRGTFTVAAATLIVMAPLKLGWSGWGAELSLQTAAAKDGNAKGGGNGHGNGGDNGDEGGGGNGDGGGNGKGKGNDGTSAPATDDSDASAGQGAVHRVNPATGDRITIRGKAIEILHRNGMRESVKGSRYLMTDDQGRTIIERAATSADRIRLRKLGG